MFLSEEEKKFELKKQQYRLGKYCDKCNGTGMVRTDNGLMEMCVCRQTARKNVRLLDWGFPQKFLNQKWDLDLLKDKPFYKQLKKYVKNFETNYEDGRGIFFHGPQGRGKTTCECAIGKEIASITNPYTFESKKKYTVGFMMFNDIIKYTFDKENRSKFNTFLFKSDLLIIDNIGNEAGKNDNQYAQRTLEMILRKRNNDCKPTILSSNYNVDEMGKEYNLDIHDFIVQNCEIVYISGDNYRLNNETEDDEDF